MPEIGKVAKVALALSLPTSIVFLYWLYKRQSSDEDVYGTQKVVTSRNITLEVSVPPKAVGAIIGRQGSRIKEIQQQTGTRLHFKGRQAGENTEETNRTMLIHGTAEAAHQTELMIYQIISDIPEVFTEDIEVPHYAIGRIIGKGGSSIREMSNASGAKIFIAANESAKYPDSPRIINITGSRQQIDRCLDLIQEKLEMEEQMRAKMAVSASNRDQRKKSKEQKDLIKVTGVRRKEDELWDGPLQGSVTTKQDCLPLKSSYFEVYVSAVEHPGHFWVQVVGAKALQLEQLQNDISVFAASDDAKLNYAVKDVISGELVASRYEDDDSMYYRAKVLGEDQGKVDLYFVDFGDNAFVEKKDIVKLRSDFCSFPFQAIECQLANVEPIGGTWTDEGITCFEDLAFCAQWKVLFAKVMTYTETGPNQKTPVVELFDTNGAKDINIADELVKRGYAKAVDSTSHNAGTKVANHRAGSSDLANGKSSDSANHHTGSPASANHGAEGGSASAEYGALMSELYKGDTINSKQFSQNS